MMDQQIGLQNPSTTFAGIKKKFVHYSLEYNIVSYNYCIHYIGGGAN